MTHAAEQDRPDVAQAREARRDAQPGPDPSRLAFLDETATTTNVARRYGRPATGERLVGKVPFGHWKATTVAAALRAGGVDAVMTCDGAINGDLFVAYVEQCLVPALKPGDVLILDGLSSHERAEARGLVEAAGASVRFLPPYSPDYNPIEQAFSKLKATLRRREGRKAEGLRAAIFAEFNDFPPEERANFLRNDGYAATPKPMPF